MNEWFESDELTASEEFELHEVRDEPRSISTMPDSEFQQLLTSSDPRIKEACRGA